MQIRLLNLLGLLFYRENIGCKLFRNVDELLSGYTEPLTKRLHS
jgi:hypothetical protein